MLQLYAQWREPAQSWVNKPHFQTRKNSAPIIYKIKKLNQTYCVCVCVGTAGLHPQIPHHFEWQLSVWVSQTRWSSYLSYMTAFTMWADKHWHHHHSDWTHWYMCTVLTCDISLGSLTLPAPEDGVSVEFTPAVCMCVHVCMYYVWMVCMYVWMHIITVKKNFILRMNYSNSEIVNSQTVHQFATKLYHYIQLNFVCHINLQFIYLLIFREIIQ